MLEEIINKIREKLDIKNKLREIVLRKSREIIHSCGKTIKYIHSGKYSEVSIRINEIKSKIRDLLQSIDNENQRLLYKSNVIVALQEFTELAVLNSLITRNEFLSDEQLNVPIEAYLGGLGDVIGELRRYCLDSIRKNDLNKAEWSLKIMDEIFENLSSLNYPNKLIPNLRRKIDTARFLIERTRGDVTNAWVMLRNRGD